MKKKLLLLAFALPTFAVIVISFLMFLKDDYEYLGAYYWGLVVYSEIMRYVLRRKGIEV